MKKNIIDPKKTKRIAKAINLKNETLDKTTQKKDSTKNLKTLAKIPATPVKGIKQLKVKKAVVAKPNTKTLAAKVKSPAAPVNGIKQLKGKKAVAAKPNTKALAAKGSRGGNPGPKREG